jgi:hypothetical protein
MHSALHILAENDTNPAKVLFGIIFVLIWFATSAMSALAKKKKAPEVRRKPPPMIPARRPIPPAIGRRNAPPISKAPPPRVQAPPPIVAAPAAFVPSMITQVRAINAAPTLVHSGIKADALREMLRPQNLRQQFLLTEILQPPLALRSDHSTTGTGEILE